MEEEYFIWWKKTITFIRKQYGLTYRQVVLVGPLRAVRHTHTREITQILMHLQKPHAELFLLPVILVFMSQKPSAAMTERYREENACIHIQYVSEHSQSAVFCGYVKTQIACLQRKNKHVKYWNWIREWPQRTKPGTQFTVAAKKNHRPKNSQIHRQQLSAKKWPVV